MVPAFGGSHSLMVETGALGGAPSLMAETGAHMIRAPLKGLYAGTSLRLGESGKASQERRRLSWDLKELPGEECRRTDVPYETLKSSKKAQKISFFLLHSPGSSLTTMWFLFFQVLILLFKCAYTCEHERGRGKKSASVYIGRKHKRGTPGWPSQLSLCLWLKS